MERRPSTVLLCGCGDSHHAADSLAHTFRSWAQLASMGSPAMEAARYLVPELKHRAEGVLLVGISVSGETARTLEALELGRQLGLGTLAITCQESGSLSTAADHRLIGELPDYPDGPGLISYLVSLLAGCALASQLASNDLAQLVDRAVGELGRQLPVEMDQYWQLGVRAADELGDGLPVTYLGSGPAYGSAMFAAAKLIEAAGRPAWAQDVEEWAHLEYFAEPAGLPTWLLSSSGRADGRETEVIRAAESIGRQMIVSRWNGVPAWPAWLREGLSPLALWMGPVALADELTSRSGERPFRGFGGGRAREEGGGPSRIRSSRRLATLKEFAEFQPENQSLIEGKI